MVSFCKIKSNLTPGSGYESVFLIRIQQLLCGSTIQLLILLCTQSIKQTSVSLPTSAMGKRISSGNFLQFYFDRHIGSHGNPHSECRSGSTNQRDIRPYAPGQAEVCILTDFRCGEGDLFRQLPSISFWLSYWLSKEPAFRKLIRIHEPTWQRILCTRASRSLFPYRLPVWGRGPLPASWRDSPGPPVRSGSGGSPRRRSYSWPCPHTCQSFRAYLLPAYFQLCGSAYGPDAKLELLEIESKIQKICV